jgi:anti-sigma regulatory factor (Ser/Thr protein kinase)
VKSFIDAIIGRRVALGRVATLHLSARSDLRAVEQVVSEVMRFFDELAHPDDDWRLRFALCLRETVYNAVLHGNRDRRDSSVAIEAQWHPDSRLAVVVVRDDGRGFDWEAALRECSAAPDDRSGRRGLMILAHMTDQIDVGRGEVRFALSLAPSPGAAN